MKLVVTATTLGLLSVTGYWIASEGAVPRIAVMAVALLLSGSGYVPLRIIAVSLAVFSALGSDTNGVITDFPAMLGVGQAELSFLLAGVLMAVVPPRVMAAARPQTLAAVAIVLLNIHPPVDWYAYKTGPLGFIQGCMLAGMIAIVVAWERIGAAWGVNNNQPYRHLHLVLEPFIVLTAGGAVASLFLKPQPGLFQWLWQHLILPTAAAVAIVCACRIAGEWFFGVVETLRGRGVDQGDRRRENG